VKIDGLYVRAALGSARERGFVVSMVELAHSVGAIVVAEMIETEEQAALMLSLGVELGQGWLFGRPGMLPGSRR
jgi:EAL domain-containing protein (putative c-di-GMP-specific phosphodiesterase class I)